MTAEVAQWATQPSISGNMIEKKTFKFCVDNLNKFILKISQNNSGSVQRIQFENVPLLRPTHILIVYMYIYLSSEW